MRIGALSVVMLVVCAPAYAQNGAMSGASSSVNISNPSNITSTTRLTTPPTVVAPGLAAAGIETCLGSASGGLSLMGTGLTFGGTIADLGCSIRLTARQLHAFGHQKAALALMCQDPRVSDAMASAGEACPTAEFAARGGRRAANSSIGYVDAPRSTSLAFGADTTFLAFAADAALTQDPADVSNVKAFSAQEERWFARDTPR